jgi:hypothetical protein
MRIASIACRGVQKGYFSFQRVRSEIMRANELLISAIVANGCSTTMSSRFREHPLIDHRWNRNEFRCNALRAPST